MAEFRGIGNGQNTLPLKVVQLVTRLLNAHWPAIASGCGSPALQSTLTHADHGTGLPLACAALDGFIHHVQDAVTRCEIGQLSSLSHSARNFFCSTSKAAASANAFSLRRSSARRSMARSWPLMRLSLTLSAWNQSK